MCKFFQPPDFYSGGLCSDFVAHRRRLSNHMKMNMDTHKFFRGQLVEVRSEEEISRMLDADGKFDGVPFMPEMVKYCGRQARVYRRANKTCVEGDGTRGMRDTVFLENLRCDGEFHDGCQRDCSLFWKEAWLKPVEDGERRSETKNNVVNGTVKLLGSLRTQVSDRYYCQSTELFSATSPLSRWNIWQFVEELRNRELSISHFFLILYRTIRHRLLGFEEVGSIVGAQKKSTRVDLDLKSGDWVKVKEAEEIRSTLDAGRKNFGLEFVPVMSEYIGRTYQVDKPVHKIIIEGTGRMVRLKNTVSLQNVRCKGLCVKNCPRNSSLYWREAWLERADKDSGFIT
jgi:hypothetical protein